MDVILRGTSNRYRARVLAIGLLAVLGLAATGVARAQPSTRSPVVTTRKIQGLGVVLVNSSGRTLYVFAKDQHRHVTCTGSCASFWPPLKWKGSGKPKAAGAARSALLSSDKNPAGGKVVTYNHWPLYTFLEDKAAGQAKGWNQNLNGGKWYVISAAGKVVKHRTGGGG